MYTKAIAGKVITGLGIAGMLLASAPIAMAHDKDDESKGRGATVSTEAKAKHDDKGLHLGSFIGLQFGKHKDGDGDRVGSTTRQERKDNRAELRSHITGGVVTAVGSSTFTIDPRGKGSTTTVTINGDTKIVTRDGATTTAAITAGTKVMVFGTTTATSTSGNTFTASVVIVFNKAIGHLRDWLHL